MMLNIRMMFFTTHSKFYSESEYHLDEIEVNIVEAKI